MTAFRIGVLQLSMEPAHETVRMAKACEDAGFDTFWLAEAYPWWHKHGYEARSSTAITALMASSHVLELQVDFPHSRSTPFR